MLPQLDKQLSVSQMSHCRVVACSNVAKNAWTIYYFYADMHQRKEFT